MPGDESLTDAALLDEIGLVGALVLAASQAQGPMSQDAIDAVLGIQGLAPGSPGATAAEAEPAPPLAGAAG